MSEGSIKGAAVEPIVNLTHELLGSGQISRQQLETRLESSDLGLLEAKPEPTLWYPIASAERIELFVAEVLGRDIEEMMREIGGAAARRILVQPGIRTFIEVLAQELIERPANVSSQRPSRGHVVFEVRVGD
jgi:hypothetical protein